MDIKLSNVLLSITVALFAIGCSDNTEDFNKKKTGITTTKVTLEEGKESGDSFNASHGSYDPWAVSAKLEESTATPVADEAAATAETEGTEPVVTDEESVHFMTVVRGDTLSGLAEAALGGQSLWVELAVFNEMEDPNFLLVGQKIRIPTETELAGLIISQELRQKLKESVSLYIAPDAAQEVEEDVQETEGMMDGEETTTEDTTEEGTTSADEGLTSTNTTDQ